MERSDIPNLLRDRRLKTEDRRREKKEDPITSNWQLATDTRQNMQTSNTKQKGIRVIFLLGMLLVFSGQLLSQEELIKLTSIPDSDGPFEVKIGYTIIDITDVNEKEETMDFDCTITMRWKDERLAYGENDSLARGIDYTKAPKLIYKGDFAISEVYPGWRPFFYIANGLLIL